MDEKPLIIAALMAEEEKRGHEKKAAEKRQRWLLDSYQPFRYDQPESRFSIGWIILGVVVIVIYLIFRN